MSLNFERHVVFRTTPFLCPGLFVLCGHTDRGCTDLGYRGLSLHCRKRFGREDRPLFSPWERGRAHGSVLVPAVLIGVHVRVLSEILWRHILTCNGPPNPSSIVCLSPV